MTNTTACTTAREADAALISACNNAKLDVVDATAVSGIGNLSNRLADAGRSYLSTFVWQMFAEHLVKGAPPARAAGAVFAEVALRVYSSSPLSVTEQSDEDDEREAEALADEPGLLCEGHESLAGEAMGATVYCDGTCQLRKMSAGQLVVALADAGEFLATSGLSVHHPDQVLADRRYDRIRAELAGRMTQ